MQCGKTVKGHIREFITFHPQGSLKWLVKFLHQKSANLTHSEYSSFLFFTLTHCPLELNRPLFAVVSLTSSMTM